jgi:hypothetical protein
MFDRSAKKCSAKKGRRSSNSKKRSNLMNTSIKSLVNLIEKHTNLRINEQDLASPSSAPMKSAVEAVLQQIDMRAGESSPIRQMIDKVRKAIK